MELESLHGQMDHNTKANSRITTCMDKDFINGQTVGSMMAFGRTIRCVMSTVPSRGQMEEIT